MHEKRPLVEALEKFHSQKNISFHVPGHKHGVLSNLPEVIKEALSYDLTELKGLDDLHHPEEAIKEAEELLASTYGATKSYFLVNGTTVGNLAMLYATCQYGEQLIVQRNAHKSIFHAIELVGVEPIFVTPEWDSRTKTTTFVSANTIKSAIEEFPLVKGVLLTYPTYYGLASNEIKEIIDYCHTKDIPVLVDEAHGAHFKANSGFPLSALDFGADIVVQSAHKTLPSMTMGSYLHMNSSIIKASKVNKYLRMLQSSSPSYLLMASLDDARSYVQRYNEMDFKQLIYKRDLFIQALQTIKLVEVIEVNDPLKLLIRVGSYSGFQVQQALEAQHVYAELADTYQVLIILPLLKKDQDYPFAEVRKRIKMAVDELKKETPIIPKDIRNKSFKSVSTIEMNMSLLNEKKGEWVPYVRSIGRIAKGILIPYPPGVPLFIPGEKITISMLTELEEWIDKGATFQGDHRLDEKLIYVVED